MQKQETKAFLIRCAPSKISRISDVLATDQIIIGWSLTRDLLLEPKMTREDFKRVLRQTYGYENNERSLGQATGYLWSFIRGMGIGDKVLVPVPGAFYLGEITSAPFYDETQLNNDMSIRRSVRWLNEKKPIPRIYCDAGLTSRLKYQGTCVEATDLMNSILEALESTQKSVQPSFKKQLAEQLKETTKNLLISSKAYLNPDRFQELVRQLLPALGATVSHIPPRTRYKNSIADVDVIGDFEMLGFRVYVQVKHHTQQADEHAVRQVMEAMKQDDEGVSKPIIGWVVNSGNFSEKAQQLADENGIRCITGDELAEMIISLGLSRFNI